MLFGIWAIALVLTNITESAVRSTAEGLGLAAAAAVSTSILFRRRGLYGTGPQLPRTEELSRVVSSIFGGAGALAILAAFLDWHLGAWEVVLALGISLVVHTLGRSVARALSREVIDDERGERVVIVGAGDEAVELTQMMVDHPECGMVLVGIVGHRPVAETHGLGDLVLGPTEDLIPLMKQHRIDTAVVTATGFRGEQFRSVTRELLRDGRDVILSLGTSRLQEGRFGTRTLAHEPLLVVDRLTPSRLGLVLKRVVDVVGSAALIAVTFPIWALVAAAIKLEDGGPVFYRSTRAGRNGRDFTMMKFRTMVIDAEKRRAELLVLNERAGPLFKVTNDPRITRVGRILRESSIDELPQLLNVLRGQMSLVGPRPALPDEIAAFDDELRSRSLVRPGITGLWQVEARSNASFGAYRRLDLHYVENWSFALDIRILMATIEQFLVSIVTLPFRRRSTKRADGIAASPVKLRTVPAPSSVGEKPGLVPSAPSARRHADVS